MTPTEYISLLFHPTETLAVVVIASPGVCSGPLAQRIVTAQTAATPGFQKWLAEANRNGTNIYLGMNPLRVGAAGRTKTDIARVKRIYLDIRSEERRVGK